MNQYWQKRIEGNEAKAAKIAAELSKKQQAYYKRAYKKIEAELNAFFAAVDSGTVSRTQLWNYQRYQKLIELISEVCGEIGGYQISLMDEVAAKVFEETVGMTLEEFGKKNTFTPQQTREQMNVLLNSEWSGNSYSRRIWHNTNRLAVDLQKQLESLVAIGKNPDEIKAEIKKTFNTSYSAADRLVRTESSYIYNTAAIESYKKGGVEEVDFLAEADCCEECAKYRNKRFRIGSEPMVPVHPNCRCTYVPVVEL